MADGQDKREEAFKTYYNYIKDLAVDDPTKSKMYDDMRTATDYDDIIKRLQGYKIADKTRTDLYNMWQYPETTPYVQDKPQTPLTPTPEAWYRPLTGMLKGAGQTGVETAALASAFNPLTPQTARQWGTRMRNDPEYKRDLLQKLNLLPVTKGEWAGQGVERGLEYLAPMFRTGRLYEAGERFLASKFPKLSNLPVIGDLMTQLPTAAGEAAFGGGMAAIHGEDVGEAAKMGAGVPLAFGAAQPLINLAGVGLHAKARNQYTKLLETTGAARQAIRDRVVEDFTKRRPWTWNRRMLEDRVLIEKKTAADNLNKLIASYPPGMKLAWKQKDVADEIDKAFKEFQFEVPSTPITMPSGEIFDPVNPGGHNMDKMIDDIMKIKEELKQRLLGPIYQGRTSQEVRIGLDALRDARQRWDKVAESIYSGTIEGTVNQIAHAKAADAIRNLIAKEFKDVGDLNHIYHFWGDLEKIVTPSARKEAGRLTPYSSRIVGGYGAHPRAFWNLGESGGALRGFRQMLSHPAWLSSTGKLSEFLSRGSPRVSQFSLPSARYYEAKEGTKNLQGVLTPEEQYELMKSFGSEEKPEGAIVKETIQWQPQVPKKK